MRSAASCCQPRQRRSLAARWAGMARSVGARPAAAQPRSVSDLRRCKSMANNVPAATQALDVLELLARHVSPLPAAAIGRDLGLPRSTTYHLLSALRERGFVVHLPDERRWGLGVAAFALGSAYTRQEPLRWIARTVLTDLVATTTHNGHFAMLHGADVLYVIEERAPG